jgi:sugar O-acyltransferase (sialic acid O-acetyltransferase NeuD family)
LSVSGRQDRFIADATEGNGVQEARPPLVKDAPWGWPAPPEDCRRILIVGAGGFGREVLQWARHAWPTMSVRIAGFLSADAHALDGHAATLPILGSPDAFKLQPGDGLVLAICIQGVRRLVAEKLAARGARFLTLIHPSAIVADSAVIGAGTVICPYAVVSDAVRLGQFVLVNYHASLGHDAQAGNFAVLSPYATLGGAASIGDDVFLGLHASLAPAVKVGSKSKVSANSTALKDSPEASLIFGVPGRHVALLELHSES